MTDVTQGLTPDQLRELANDLESDESRPATAASGTATVLESSAAASPTPSSEVGAPAAEAPASGSGDGAPVDPSPTPASPGPQQDQAFLTFAQAMRLVPTSNTRAALDAWLLATYGHGL